MRAFKLAVVGLAAVIYGCGSAASSSNSGPKPLLKEATVVIGGQQRTVLATSAGFTLYLFRPEKDGKVACVDSCLSTWRPLLLPAGRSQASAAAGLPGTLGQVGRPDGQMQLTYDEWPLYTFAGDARPGTVAGEGVMDSWFAVEASMPLDADNDNDGTQAAAAPPSPTAAPPAPAPAAPPTTVPAPVPAFNDNDADNRGGPSDNDGNG